MLSILTSAGNPASIVPPNHDKPNMFAHDLSKEDALAFSHFDEENLLSPASAHPIELEGEQWKTAEHYLQAQLARNSEYATLIKNAGSAREAHRLGNVWYKRKCKNWKNLRRVLMTRALYTKAMMYPAVKAFLLETGDQKIVETSLYDHYWGLGRDQRGENMLGKVWMDIRKKIREDAASDLT